MGLVEYSAGNKEVCLLKVAVSWSGGKDSCMAYHQALAEGHEIQCIIVFIWEQPSPAHPLSVIELQAKAVEKDLFKAKVTEPYFEQYKQVILQLVSEKGIEAIVTGDIAPVDAFHGNWMDNVCNGLNVKVLKPLWGLDRYELLKSLIEGGYKAVFSCVKRPWFDDSWIGRELDWESIRELKALRQKYGIDLSGEYGEYHTLILDAPFFKKKIEISKYEIEKSDKAFYMKVKEAFLKSKT
ncbi:MAG: diphthine--ammonia ligase [Candidatus Bathyarchaeia archaeon]